MEKKILKRKLVISKEKISKLSNEELNGIMGGGQAAKLNTQYATKVFSGYCP